MTLQGMFDRESRGFGHLTGALATTLITVPVAIGVGYLAFLPLGAEAAVLGPQAGLFGAAFVSIVASLAGGCPAQITGPKTSLAVIVTSLLAGVMAHPEWQGGTAALLGLLGFSVLLAALFQALLGLGRVGQVIKFIPYPVTAGFMNGLAALIVLGQIDVLWSDDTGIRLGAILAVGCAVGCFFLVRNLYGQGPWEALAAVVGGWLAFHGAKAAGLDAGPMLAALPAGLPPWPDFQAAADWLMGDLARLKLIIVPAILIGLVGALESLLGAVSADNMTGDRHRSNRELMGVGAANALAGLFALLPGAGSPTRTASALLAGGGGRLTGLIHGLVLLGLGLLAGGWVGYLPMAAISGLLIAVAVDMVDGRTRRLVIKGPGRGWAHPRSVAIDMGVIYAVALMTVAIDLVTAVVTGFAVSALRFIALAGEMPVRRLITGDKVHSKQARTRDDAARLGREGDAILLAELQGPLFFGATDNLRRQLEPALEDRTGRPIRFLIFDMRRVDAIDATGAQILDRLTKRLDANQGGVLLAGMTRDHPGWRFLTDIGVISETGTGPGRPGGPLVFANTDTALSWAEDAVLNKPQNGLIRPLELGQMDALHGLTQGELDAFSTVLEPVTFVAGETLFSEGEWDTSLLLISRGTVSVRAHSTGHRLAGIGPGLMVGEMALLTGAPRSADVVADGPVDAWKLSRETFEKLQTDNPPLATKLLRSLAAEQARRLYRTSAEVRTLMD